MKLFFASGFWFMSSVEREKLLYEWGVRNRMYSYFYIKNKRYGETFYGLLDLGMFELIVDSGAFSAHTLGKDVRVEEYGEWLVSVKDRLKYYVNLDVIPESLDRLEETAERGWENLKYLESRGLKPLPVFRMGEPDRFFRKIVDNYEYFCLSKTAPGMSKKASDEYLDRYWSRLVDEKGRAIRKVHGLAVTDIKLLSRYPWYSVDSSSWGQYSMYGYLVRESYDGKLRAIAVSSRNPVIRRSFRHYQTLSEEEKEELDLECVNVDDNLWRVEKSVKFYVGLEKKIGMSMGFQETLF